MSDREGGGRDLAWGLGLSVLAWAWQGADIRPMALWRDSANMATFAKDFFPPDFHDWRIYLHEMVGAGGIGVILHEVIRSFDYAQTSAVLLIITASVTLIDITSAGIRHWAT